MQLSKLLIQKTKYKNILIREFWLLRKNKTIWLIDITDKNLLKNLLPWLMKLPVNFIILLDEKNFSLNSIKNIAFTDKIELEKKIGFDFIIWDDEVESLENYFKYWVVPIVKKDNYLSSILKEFDAKNYSWNSFLYDELDEFSIFFAVVRYLENKKFPYDNKNLVKNLLEKYQ